MATKVVLEQTVLVGSDVLQRVATVYIDGVEYRVSAPPKAKGAAADWIEHLYVRQWGEMGAEEEVGEPHRSLAVAAVEEQLRNTSFAEGLHPDGVHCTAQICEKGHVQHCDGAPFDSNAHCTQCGAACTDRCLRCKDPIQGAERFRPTDSYTRPLYCHRCGRPYPWMEDRLQTARELLYHDEKLTMEDRQKLFDLLAEVMSDPKSGLAPAKKKLIGIRLEKAGQVTKELVLDLVAKTTAEVIKG